MGFFAGLADLVGLSIVTVLFAVLLYIPITLFTGVLGNTYRPTLTKIVSLVISFALVQSVSEGAFTAAAHAVFKPILIVGVIFGIIMIIVIAGETYKNSHSEPRSDGTTGDIYDDYFAPKDDD